MNEKMRNDIIDIIERIDKKREELEKEYKKTPQYKRLHIYRQADQEYLNRLTARRNALVCTLNYDYTGNIKELEELLDE